MILFCLIPAKAKKNYEQKCRDKDEAEQAVHRSANMANPKQQEKVPGRANSLKNPRFTYVKLELINNLNNKKKDLQSKLLAVPSFRLLESSESEKPMSYFEG